MKSFLQKLLFKIHGASTPTFIASRSRNEQYWRDKYGQSMDMVSDILDIVVASFMLKPEDKYRLRLQDSLGDIYRHSVRSPLQADSLEYETLIKSLKQTVRVDTTRFFATTEHTLEELVSFVVDTK